VIRGNVALHEGEINLSQTKHQSRLIPAAKWDSYHPWPSKAGLRFLIFKSKNNGLAAAVLRVGRRVLIDEDAFFAWVANQNGGRS
jgi:hypothetical protein